MSLSTGALAPDFTARNQHGESVRLADRLAGGDGPVLLVFYPWAFSGICTGELVELHRAHARLVEAGVSVWAVSSDAMFTLRAFADAQRLPFDLLSDHCRTARSPRRTGCSTSRPASPGAARS